MIKPALTALVNELKDNFTELDGRIYKNWPGPQLQEKYPYMVIFMRRAPIQHMQYTFIKDLDDNSKLYGAGYFEMDVDINYLASGGDEDDQANLVDKMDSFFNVNLSDGDYSEVSRNIKYMIRDYEATANVRLLEVVLDQTGEDLQEGDRRSIFSLSMYTPRFKIQTPRVWTGYKIDAEVRE